MRRFAILSACLLVVTTLAAVLFVYSQREKTSREKIIALWVTRFDYRTPEDVRAIIRNTADSGFTDVFFQIRGNGTSFYKSSLEPWAFELSGRDVSKTGTDPGWDPLQTAINAAQNTRLRVHAYMNVLPGWKGSEEPPQSANQLWTAHPDWFMVDSLGDKMLPTSGWYSFLNPVMPEVRNHLKGIVRELCQYDVAGVHLDYIRYPNDYRLVADQRYPGASEKELFRRSEFSYDPVSQAELFNRYGWDVSKDEIAEFRCESISRMVRDISYVMQVEKPEGCILSASVKGNPVAGKYTSYQDSGSWARKGLVDWVVQMNYGTDSFAPYLNAMEKAAGRKKFSSSVVVGIYCGNDTDDLLKQVEQIENSGCRGIAVFSYEFLFQQHRPTEKGRKLIQNLRP